MNKMLPGTDIQIGKWYHATQIPPRLIDEHGKEKYSLLLGIKDLGMIPGIYSESRNTYEWDCQRYEGAPRLGWLNKEQINNNLDWVLEPARGVSCWMIIPNFDNKIASIDGKTGFTTDHAEGCCDEKANVNREEKLFDTSESGSFLGLHLN